MNTVRYRAFMSYCHADESWAAWLHRALESYRVPRRLAGTAGAHGKVPAKLSPIFRDREELSSATDLSEKIKDALADSESLLVICSPAAARSVWVNEEIRHFRAKGGTRIYSVIVDGDPNTKDPQQACFPRALLERADQELVEPLAADVRKWADGKSLTKLKVAASILGVRLDELRQRELQRKRKMRMATGIAAAAVTALLLFSVQSRMAERDARMAREAQRTSAEGMLAQFLEQSERLGDVADLETRKAFEEVMSSYLADLDPADLTPESRRQLGVTLTNRGAILRAEGHLDQAMEVFQRAQQTLQLLVDEARGDVDALFELSQAEYWIGQVHLDLGRMEEAGQWFNAYAEASNILHAMQPGNADFTMEAAYAQSNLGNLETRRVPSDPELALQYYSSALRLNQEAARQDPSYERELIDSHADVADAMLGVCDLTRAMEHRLKNVELAARLFSLNPVSNRLKEDYAHALSGLFWVQQQSGDLVAAMDSLQRSLDLHAELVEEDPSNINKRWNMVRKSAYQAQILHFTGAGSESLDLSLAVEKDMKNLKARNQDIRIDQAIDYAVFLREFAWRANQRGKTVLADRLLAESMDELGGLANEHPDNKRALNELALAYFLYWRQNDTTLPNQAAKEWMQRVRQSLNSKACSDLDITARLSVMAGKTEVARNHVARLTGNGYQEPEFKQFCTEYRLCTTAGTLK